MRRAGALLPPRRAPAASTPPDVEIAGRASESAWGEALFAVVPDGVAVLDPEGQVVRWSAEAERLTGRTLAWLRRMGFVALFRDRTGAKRALLAAAAGDAPLDLECALRHADGHELPVRLRAAALPPGPPELANPPVRLTGREAARGVLVLLEDQSEVHTIRRRLIETEKLSAMAKIAGSIAHEFRNPLNSLFLSADLLEDELGEAGTKSESVTTTLGAVREEIERLNQIITHYLALSKIGGTEREPLDLTRVAAGFVAEQRERASARGVGLVLQGSADPCVVLADRHQVRRVLLNLLDNALDALDGEGAKRPGARVTFSARRSGEVVLLGVRDNGPGLPASVREKPFEPFRSTKPRGAGLGLYLVREIVSAHAGSIALLDARGGGTRVVVRLPAARPARARGRR